MPISKLFYKPPLTVHDGNDDGDDHGDDVDARLVHLDCRSLSVWQRKEKKLSRFTDVDQTVTNRWGLIETCETRARVAS